MVMSWCRLPPKARCESMAMNQQGPVSMSMTDVTTKGCHLGLCSCSRTAQSWPSHSLAILLKKAASLLCLSNTVEMVLVVWV